jgi:hypothetical protein
MTIERKYLESHSSFRDRQNTDQIIRQTVARDPHIPARDVERVADTAAKIVENGGGHGLNWGQIADAAKAAEGV